MLLHGLGLDTVDLEWILTGSPASFVQSGRLVRRQRLGTLVKPPLVTIVISNYNYGRYLEEAIQSVKRQNYSNVQCIAVDDCSTDDSSAVVAKMREAWPDVEWIGHRTNLGQSAAILSGLSRATGQYVAFLDADDVLAPEFVETHLAVHMSSIKPVGFTCCDALQICDGYIVRGRNASVAKQFKRPADMSLVSPAPLERLAQKGLPLPWVPPTALRHIVPRDLDWAWSSTSCMFFRKDMLDLICGAAALPSMRIGTDNYLATVSNLWTGSIVIDRQLVDYRIHGKNNFSKRIQLQGFADHDPSEDYAPQTIQVLFADLETRFQSFADRVEYKERFVEIFSILRNWIVRSGMGEAGKASLVAQLVSRNRPAWEPLVGPRVFAKMLAAASSEDLDAYLEPFETMPDNAVSWQPARETASDAWGETARRALPFRMVQHLAGLVRR